MKRKMHLRDRRLLINAGMVFPACYSNPKNGLLDTDKSHLWITTYSEDVTCKRCKQLMKRN